MIFAEKAGRHFRNSFVLYSDFATALMSIFNTGISRLFKLQKKKHLHNFCRKKPAGIFGTLLFSIQISQQLLFQQYLIPALVDCLNFKKRNIYTIFAEKSRPAFLELFCSPFGFGNRSYVKNINGRHFSTFQTSKIEISTQFLQKKAGLHFRNFFLLHSDFATALMSTI